MYLEPPPFLYTTAPPVRGTGKALSPAQEWQKRIVVQAHQDCYKGVMRIVYLWVKNTFCRQSLRTAQPWGISENSRRAYQKGELIKGRKVSMAVIKSQGNRG